MNEELAHRIVKEKAIEDKRLDDEEQWEKTKRAEAKEKLHEKEL